MKNWFLKYMGHNYFNGGWLCPFFVFELPYSAANLTNSILSLSSSLPKAEGRFVP